jgi:hypothetical protein
MPLYYFPVEYHGARYEDESGEELANSQAAVSHAKAIAEELSRNNSKAVKVFVLADDRASVIHTINGAG